MRGIVATSILMLIAGDVGADASDDCVILLHGLSRTAVAMQDLADALAESGYRVANVDYPSRDHPIQDLAPMATGMGLHLCGDVTVAGKIHFVTHSLGGILVRYYFADNSITNMGRVVMLAPPNQGSRAADAMKDVPGFDWVSGPAGKQMGKGENSIPLQLPAPDFEFAVIAGDRSIDPVTSAVLDDPDDGKVSVDDTRLEGMRDFIVLPVSHAFIMQDETTIRLVLEFLARGEFGKGG